MSEIPMPPDVSLAANSGVAVLKQGLYELIKTAMPERRPALQQDVRQLRKLIRFPRRLEGKPCSESGGKNAYPVTLALCEAVASGQDWRSALIAYFCRRAWALESESTFLRVLT